MNIQNEFSMLNPEQAKAVNTIEGPVMVEAGPGTGKTQMLGLRIANILNSDVEMSAHNIYWMWIFPDGVLPMPVIF